MPERKGWMGKAPKILKETRSTTQLLALVVLAVAAGLIGTGAIGGDPPMVYLGSALLLAVVVAAGALEWKRISTGPRLSPGQSDAVQAPIDYDVFISTPMAAHDDDAAREAHREDVLKVKDALRIHCKMDRSFYAGTDIADEDTFESEDLSLRHNFDALTKSENFLLIYPRRVASSMLVEAGMALAAGKTNVWFVKKGEQLPFLLRGGANASGKSGLPNIRIYAYDDIDDIVLRIKNNGRELFKTS